MSDKIGIRTGWNWMQGTRPGIFVDTSRDWESGSYYESINNDFKNSIISNKFEYKFISKIVKKDNNIKKKIIEEILPLLEDKLVY